ncbi:hypothetical protein DXG03_000732 [Asterophora parasitica]|uniref:Uncharacterized protein n=1 Tax=Asterophora parasitica TaxID=117018 RepID=A0A9P7G5J4_9AGAR|nr:hypothetical protein DXG03_000732 [Asterophora parasitica]
MRQYIGTLDREDHLRVPADNSLSIAEGSTPPPRSLTAPEGDLTSLESDNIPTALSWQASTSQTGVAIPNREDSGVELEVHHSVDSLLPQTQVPPALEANGRGPSSPSWVVPETWKSVTSLTVKRLIVPKMFIAILKECPELQNLSVHLRPPISSEELDDEIDVLEITRVEKLEMLSILTSAEPHPIFQYLRLPNLKSLSLAWDRLGQDLWACPDGLKIDKLLEESLEFNSMSLSNTFPPEEELLAILGKHGKKFKELFVRADSTPGFLALSLERLVTRKTLSALSHGGRLRTLDLSYASAEAASAPWQLAISFANTTVEQAETEEVHKML